MRECQGIPIRSIELAAEKFRIKLVLLLDPAHCGAMQATLEAMSWPIRRQSHNHELLKGATVHTNISVSACFLRHGSELIEQLNEQRLLVVGAEYWW